jgi:homocysteine S-methyltransferase
MTKKERIDPTKRFLSDQGYLVLDGGLASELEARGLKLESELWSAAVLVDEPEIIYQVYLDYLTAGADCIASASYQATVEGLTAFGLNEASAHAVLRDSVDLAIKARDKFWSQERNRVGRLRPIVAASIGPYGAYLADGSEYRGDYDRSEDELVDFHRPRWETLCSAGPDLMACETIPSRDEVRALRRLIELDSSPPTWVSLNCRNPLQLANGDALDETIADLRVTRNVVALGVNCVAPGLVADLVATIRSGWDKPIVAYPNSGEIWDAVRKLWIDGYGQADPFVDALEWYERGARILGGCCRTCPGDIKRLRTVLSENSSPS